MWRDKLLIINWNNVSLLMIAIPPRVGAHVVRPAIPVVQCSLTVVSPGKVIVIHGVLIAVVSCRPAILVIYYRRPLVH